MPRRILLLLAAVALAALGCGAEAVTPAAAVVDGRKVAESVLNEELNMVRQDPSFQELVQQQGDEAYGFVRRQILSQLIRVTFMEQEAQRLGIEVTDVQVTNFIEEIKEEVGGQESFDMLLEQENLTLDRLRMLATRQLYQEGLEARIAEDLRVEEEHIREAYEANIDQFSELHVARITVEDEPEAQQIADRARADEDFGDLAREHSTDEAADEGGDLGYVDLQELGMLGPQLEGLDEGEVAGPLPGLRGFEIYKVLERRAIPLADVRDEIEQGLLQEDRRQAFEDWMSSALSSADVTVNPKYGTFDRETLQVVEGSGELPE